MHFHIVPTPRPVLELGRLLNTKQVAYAVFADIAVMLVPAKIDEALAVVLIVLQQPLSIVELHANTLPLNPLIILEYNPAARLL